MWTALLAHIKSGRLAVKDVRVIEVKKSVFESNDERAALLRKDLKDKLCANQIENDSAEGNEPPNKDESMNLVEMYCGVWKGSIENGDS